MQKFLRHPRHFRSFTFVPIVFSLVACSLVPRIPTVSDPRLEALVVQEAGPIIAVTADRDNVSQYSFYLSDFPRKDILGLSTGNRRIYISYRLAQYAAQNPPNIWLLRQTLAHEIAHEIKGHVSGTGTTSFNRSATGSGVTGTDVGLSPLVKFRTYPVEKELEADLEGMKYWSRLHWDCRIWVGILQGFEQQNYAGDSLHPTGERLKQAIGACAANSQNAIQNSSLPVR
jgi:predicted Zn-dependent protease